MKPRTAERGILVTITRKGLPIVHISSNVPQRGLIDTMELLADGKFARQLERLRLQKLKFHPASSLAD